MKKFLTRNKKAIIGIIIAVIIGGSLIVSQSIKADSKRQAESDKSLKEMRAKISYNSCKELAYSNYSSNWENECKIKNLNKDCSLPLYLANELDSTKAQDEKDCLEIYKIEMN